MIASPLKKFLVRPAILSGAVFCLLTLPLAALGSNKVAIQLQEEPFFHGKLRDVAAPYLGFATVLSLGVAIGSVAVTGWRQSSRKSAHLEDKLSLLQKNLQETEVQLEGLKVSELQLQASGLNIFLENGVALNQQLTSRGGTSTTHLDAVVALKQVPEQAANTAHRFESQTLAPLEDSVFPAHSEAVVGSMQVTEQAANAAQMFEPQTIMPLEESGFPAHSEAVVGSMQVTEQAANAAQRFEPQTIMPLEESVPISQTVPVSETTFSVKSQAGEISLATVIALAQSEPLGEIKELKSQFQQMMAQMETIQQIILSKPQSFTLGAEVPVNGDYTHNQLSRKQQVLESSPVPANFKPDRSQRSRQRSTAKAKRQQQKLAAS